MFYYYRTITLYFRQAKTIVLSHVRAEASQNNAVDFRERSTKLRRDSNNRQTDIKTRWSTISQMQSDDSILSAREANSQLDMAALIEEQILIIGILHQKLVEAQENLNLDAVELDDMKWLYKVIFMDFKAHKHPNFMCPFPWMLLGSL